MIRSALFMLALLAFLAACSDSGDGLDTTAASTPTPDPAVSPEGTEGAQDTADATATATSTDEASTSTPTPTATPNIDMDSPAFTEDSTISTVGIDEVFFGMLAEDAGAAASTFWIAEPEENPECWFATPANGPDGVRLMIWESTVERVDIETELITTRSGAGVGSTTDDLRGLFGERLDEADPNRLVFVPADEEDADFRIIFDMVDGVVVAYRAGRVPMVELEGCP